MSEKKLSNKYKQLIKYLINNNYILLDNFFYKKDNITIKLDSNTVLINMINENRRYYFSPSDTTNNFLINFLSLLNNNIYTEV